MIPNFMKKKLILTFYINIIFLIILSLNSQKLIADEVFEKVTNDNETNGDDDEVNEDIEMKGSGIILFDGSKFLINNMKECVKELYQIFKDENCNIKPKIQKI